jgi:hypothetical protein
MERVPYCGSCLSDFDLYHYPYRLSCRHLYCSLCLSHLSTGHGAFKCLHDGALTPDDSIQSEVQLYQQITNLKKALESGQDGSAEAALLSTLINYSLVVCRAIVQTGDCSHGEACPYDHHFKSVNLAQKHQSMEMCTWECPVCLLTLSKQIGKCPVCDTGQEEQRKPETRASVSRSTNRGTGLDQLSDEEKSRGSRPSLAMKLPYAEDGDKLERSARSVCCVIQ